MKKQKKSKLGLPLKTKTTAKHVAKRAAAKKVVRHNRPLHKHLVLSPLGVFGLLCVGVLLVTFTLKAAAGTTAQGTITVNGTYPAPPLTDPAVITSPDDGLQTTTQALVVAGTCPDNSYVEVMDNGVLSAQQTCTSGGFQVNLDLTSGSNAIQAQDYNVTNSPGPSSTGITVTYTPPPPPPSTTTPPQTPTVAPAAQTTATPLTLLVTQVDLGVPLNVTSVQDISYQPTFAGVAPPFSKIFIVVHSDVYHCDTVATAQGYWTCTLPNFLPVDVHHVDVSATTPDGRTLVYPEFEVQVTTQAPPNPSRPATFKIGSSYAYSVYAVGQTVSYDVHVGGGNAPYAFTVLWGDGANATIIRQNANTFTISHKYGWINASSKVDTLKIQGISADGQASALQFSVPLRNPGFHGTIAGITTSTKFYSMIEPWLWLLWPGYIIVILLGISFWLGEREEMRRLMSLHRIPPVTGDHHHHLHFHH